MCTVITSEQKGNPEIAKEDIKVYKKGKTLDNKFYPSYIPQFSYVKNELYTTEFTYTRDGEWDLACDSIESEYRMEVEHPKFVRQGYHAFSTLKRAMNSISTYGNELVIGLFIIPKGAKYYVNPAKCIVSNQIIFKEVIKD